jgi:putative transposase
MARQIWWHGCVLLARLKELEAENRQLKKMYAEERLKADIVKEALEKKW